MSDNRRQTIAEALWRYDRAHDIWPNKGTAGQPIALPKLALALEMNSAYYGPKADAVIEALDGSPPDDTIQGE